MDPKPAVLRLSPDPDLVKRFDMLMRARHVIIHVDSFEEERVGALLDHLAERSNAARYDWVAHRGLCDVRGGDPVKDSLDPLACLRWITKVSSDAIFHLRGFGAQLTKDGAPSLLREVHHELLNKRSVIVITDEADIPKSIENLVTHFELPPYSTTEYHQMVSAIIRDLRQRSNIDVALTPEDVHALLEDLKGLSLFEVQKVVSEAVVEDRRLDAQDLIRIRQAKMRIIERSGILEYTPTGLQMSDVAGLERLKSWVKKRADSLKDPIAARQFGIEPPRGLLLLGVQGCGKSLSAKAVATELGMPLVRMDPSNLYNKFFGESEKNLRRAIRLAESMAPVVLWIDELEKAFASVSDGGNDGGVSNRLFGTFLTWLSDKKETVFVVATANDVSKLPPELVRKGRFDEIFFVDLPSKKARKEVFTLHIKKRGHDVNNVDLDLLAQASEGFSGSEIEQAVVASLYSAFHRGREVNPLKAQVKSSLDTQTILHELENTIPLSRTMHEKIDGLRAWAAKRAIPADADEPLEHHDNLALGDG